jgi:hypothetical protein
MSSVRVAPTLAPGDRILISSIMARVMSLRPWPDELKPVSYCQYLWIKIF